MVLCSSRTGQAALQTLPSSSSSNHNGYRDSSFDISNYPLPKNALQNEATTTTTTNHRRSDSLNNSDNVSVVSTGTTASSGIRRSLNKFKGSPRRRSTVNGHYHHQSTSIAEGIAVYKINKNGKLQARRLAFSLDRRSLLVTTTRIKSIRGLFKAATGSSGSDVKTLDLSRVDRIQKGLHTTRFRRATRPSHSHSNSANSSMMTSMMMDNSDNSHSHHNHKSNHNPNPPELLQEVLHGKSLLSVIYEQDGTFESLDLYVPDYDDYENIVETLEGLVRLHGKERNCKTRELQLLQFYWQEMGKPLVVQTTSATAVSDPLGGGGEGASLSLSDFFHLADQLCIFESIGKHKLAALFKQFCEGLKRKNELLTFAETAALVEKARNLQNLAHDDPLERLWNQMVATDPVPAVAVDDDASYHSYELNVMSGDEDDDIEESVSTVAFLSFLRSQQKEFVRTLEEATELVNALNCLQTSLIRRGRGTRSGVEQSRIKTSSSKTIAPDDRLTKSRFMDYMISDMNDLLSKKGEMDMTRPLSHYFIATSHDSFLSIPASQTFAPSWNVGDATSVLTPQDKAEVESIYTVLYRGVRCLETIVWDGPNHHEPIVSLTEDASTAIRFRNCLDAIVYFLECEPETFPILLKIENHCSTAVQSVLAQQIRETLGLPGLLFEPEMGLQDSDFQLPSPIEARGKVIVLGKRPREQSGKQGSAPRVMNDDYDASNDEWDLAATASQIKYFDDEEASEKTKGVVVGFNVSGPIYSTDIHAVADSPQFMWEQADQERIAAEQAATEATQQADQLLERADKREQQALEMSQKAGFSAEDFRQRKFREPPATPANIEEEKSFKDDEGVEIHEVLSSFVEANQQEYAKAAHEAMEAAKRVGYHKKVFDSADERLQHARKELDQAKDHVNYLVEESQKARLKATANYEHAQMATARLDRVKDLLKNSEETSTSAETVVVTALTEAKISEKRAADAESRASRAFANAAKDRARSDEETRKEEDLEHKVTTLLGQCKDASKAVKVARDRVEKSAGALDRVTDQIRLIENSSNYKKEIRSGTSPSNSPSRHGSSFVDKREAKSLERDVLVRKVREASDALKAAEADKVRLQKEFEESNQVLRLQTELASKMRKVADRSAHVAEELAEHAEEEREAANLRHIARERAEENVQNRGTHKESLQTQFEQAQRAASEAAQLAEDSRKRADRLEQELQGAQDFNRLLQIVEEREWARNEAKTHYDRVVAERKEKDKVLLTQKQMVEVADEVRQNTRQNISDEEDRKKNKKYYQQEAITAYDEAAVLRREAEAAKQRSEVADAIFKEKRKIARRALEYKNTMSLVVEIPPNLSAQTLLHSLRFYHWEKSTDLSNAHYHSVPFHVLHKIVESQPDYHVRNAREFTESHLCRVYPSRNDAQKNSLSNYDPVFPWSLGCQLVSMNYNTPDEHLLVAEGMFRRNASCGYVLKPQRLFGPRREEDLQRWSVRILGAYHLPKLAGAGGSRRQNASPSRPVVRLTLHSGKVGALPFTFETRQSYRPGTDPVLYTEDNICTFDVGNQWVAMASFTVWDKSTTGEKSNFVAGAAIPVSCFREGYRSIALFDAHHSRAGPYKFASVLVYVSKGH